MSDTYQKNMKKFFMTFHVMSFNFLHAIKSTMHHIPVFFETTGMFFNFIYVFLVSNLTGIRVCKWMALHLNYVQKPLQITLPIQSVPPHLTRNLGLSAINKTSHDFCTMKQLPL